LKCSEVKSVKVGRAKSVGFKRRPLLRLSSTRAVGGLYLDRCRDVVNAHVVVKVCGCL